MGGDRVEHDRHDHLVGAGTGLEDAGDTTPHQTSQGRPDDGQQQVGHGRQVPGDAHVAGRDRPENHLPLTTDVEQAGAEGDGHAESGDDERGGVGQRVGDGTDHAHGGRGPPVEDGTAQQGAVGLAQGGSGGVEEVAGAIEQVGGGVAHLGVSREDEDRAEEQGGQDREQPDDGR